MRKELEAVLIIAAKSLGCGVVGVDRERAREFGAVPAVFVRGGELVPGTSTRAPCSGYYPIGEFRRTAMRRAGQWVSIGIDSNSPGDGWTRYTLHVYTSGGTGVSSSPFGHGCHGYQEICEVLRAIANAVEFKKGFFR